MLTRRLVLDFLWKETIRDLKYFFYSFSVHRSLQTHHHLPALFPRLQEPPWKEDGSLRAYTSNWSNHVSCCNSLRKHVHAPNCLVLSVHIVRLTCKVIQSRIFLTL